MGTPSIHLLFLWHMHQPYYKDLVTGEYRLPWVRMHALKDYYGMVKLLEEFPGLHQTFNLVPSLMVQVQDYVSGAARDPFLDAASRPAAEMGLNEKTFALRYLFQANVDNLIARYPRYRQLWQEFHTRLQDVPAAAQRIRNNDLTDLQVLSQIAWMDEFFLDDSDIRELIEKGRDYTQDDQQLVVAKEKEFLGRVLPAYSEAAQSGAIEISTSPFYHPILPLVCDTNIGAVSHGGLPLPAQRFSHPEDAREQIERGLKLHEQVFGVRPRGMWPSEGSVSNQALEIAHELGLNWVGTDEGVLGRSIGVPFHRSNGVTLDAAGAGQLYRIFRWEQGESAMHMVFRDHSFSDLIGFVYSGMPAREAAEDFIHRIKESAAPLLRQGRNAVVPVILDGENAWEYYPQSGREFLRRMYDAIQKDPAIEALTVSEAIERETAPQKLASIFPGSWINANFDIWIGAPEDNIAWDHLSAARRFFAENAGQATPEQKQLAHEELLIAEGSDWNWWYGPEHHSDNDREFDELYRKHLSNVYLALGAAPPDILAQPIAGMMTQPHFTPQTAYISPEIDGRDVGYFEWLGAAAHVADRYSSAMHGKLFLLDTGYAGIDDTNLYCRLDFMEDAAEWAGDGMQLTVAIETKPSEPASAATVHRLEADISGGRVRAWTFAENGGKGDHPESIELSLESIFECRVPLALLKAPLRSMLCVRFSLWRDRLPLDALPQEGAIEVLLLPESELNALPYAKP
ncbi:MAG TPA: glycoside hydrolase family 57 protein [Candidatus Angelobacter sp.]|nr:glycoside hydrolase family 57 protein [Candidatus Angelobacter sp.]